MGVQARGKDELVLSSSSIPPSGAPTVGRRVQVVCVPHAIDAHGSGKRLGCRLVATRRATDQRRSSQADLTLASALARP